MPPAPPPPSFADGHFVKRLFMVLGVVMAGLAAYQLAHVLMLVFASVLVAVLLTALADGVERVTRLPRAAAMAVAVLALLAGMVGFGVLFAQQLDRQLADVVDLLPGAVSNLGDRLGFEWDLSADAVRSVVERSTSGTTLGHALGYGSTFVSVLTDLSSCWWAASTWRPTSACTCTVWRGCCRRRAASPFCAPCTTPATPCGCG
jgi:predicted PurR-regulated permease PerM